MEYYSVLGVNTDASDEEIRRAYRKLAMQWHPDRWARSPSHLGEAKQKFQQIQEAYSVLADGRKRMLYDAGLYDRADEEDEVEGFADFLQEMVSLMHEARKEEKNYSFEELQGMFWEMTQDFEMNNYVQQSTYNSQWFCGPFSATNDSSMMQGDPHLNKLHFGTYGAHHFCR